jgi:cation diffusion facilitator CzcD-associated flavoprotein CzcO
LSDYLSININRKVIVNNAQVRGRRRSAFPAYSPSVSVRWGVTSDSLDAVIVGAGFGGMGAAIELKQAGYDNFAILDREDDLGGTWYVNHYPGLAVDIPSTTYSYWFEPNSVLVASARAWLGAQAVCRSRAEKYGLRRFMRFSTTVEGARWDEDAQVWQVALAGGETLRARFLITATGFLSLPRVPDIPGVNAFAGKVIHTANWGHNHHIDDRRVAAIGTGVTAVQLIPELAKKVAELTVYQRTAIWVVPKVDFPIPSAVQRSSAHSAPNDRRAGGGRNISRRGELPKDPVRQLRGSPAVQGAYVRLDPRQGAAPKTHAALQIWMQTNDVQQRLLSNARPPTREIGDESD